MRSSLIALPLVALAATEVAAFPAMASDATLKAARSAFGNVKDMPRVLKAARDKKSKRDVGFDAEAQYVSNTGTHAFVAPNFGNGDQRGPCPGLNAAANHGYIDHSGVDTFNNILSGVNEAYGMALDLATFLAVYGTIFDGNPVSLTPGYSIGGASSKSQNILGNLLGILGTPQGLSGSHNKYEADTSPTRGDQYVFGEAYTVQLPYAEEYVAAIPTTPVDADTLYEDHLFTFRQKRFDDSLNGNGHFFFSPFAGILVAPAGYNFPPRMMSNKSAEFPTGYLSRETFMSFFALSGEPGSLTYTEGHERIPDNWYKRAIGDEYTIAGFLADVIEYALRDPRLLDVGGNTGEPNTFTPVDISTLTGGVFEASTLLEGNNLECFILQSIQAAQPDVLGGTLNTDGPVFDLLSTTIARQLVGASCPQLSSIDYSVYSGYPGYTDVGGKVV